MLYETIGGKTKMHTTIGNKGKYEWGLVKGMREYVQRGNKINA